MLAKGLRYHAGAGTQFTGLCAIPPVRIPYDAKKNTNSIFEFVLFFVA